MKELYEIAPKENRQAQIEALAIGESLAIARRINLEFGMRQGGIAAHNIQLRGITGQQIGRARKRFRDRTWTVENISAVTREGALIVCAVITRID